MAGKASLATALLLLGGCWSSTDVVAAYDGETAHDGGAALDGGPVLDGDVAHNRDYGAYDPDHPPQVIGGGVSATDPTLFLWQDTYWVFSTGPGISVQSSKDLNTFNVEKQVFAQNPSWIADKITAFKVGDLWSPYVALWDSTFHLYYAASTYSTDCACIGHATAPSNGQVLSFTDDQNPVICSNLSSTCVDNAPPGTETFTAIDPAVIKDAAGDRWMVFGSWGSGIQMVALDGSGRLRDPSSKPIPIAARAAGDSPAVQAASIFHWRDYYYLFVSYDNSPNHVLRVGRAAKVGGPFLDSNGMDMKDGGGRLVLKGNDRFKGPGSNMVLDDGVQLLNVFHAYDAASSSGPAMLRIAQLVFDSDGWPVSGGP